ncbi:MAG: hypothetical protein QOJ64_1072 [Acidobacteriota bacterium]|nr:hypothetical protein [Acidobacteriota bacterium]
MVYDFGDGREWDLDDLAITTFDLDTGGSQRLGGLHASNNAAYAIAVAGDDFDVVFAVERAQGCEGFCYFHWFFPRFLLMLTTSPASRAAET